MSDFHKDTSFGWLSRILFFPLCLHLHVLDDLAPEDAPMMRKLGLLMWLCFCWEAALFANAGHIMLAEDGQWAASQVLVALLMASIIMLADAVMFIAASWNAHGLAEIAKVHGFALPVSLGGRIKSIALIGGRFAMALLIANVIATVSGLIFFEKDISKIVESHYQQANAALFVEASRRVDEDLEKAKANLADRRSLVTQTENEARHLREVSLDPAVEDAERTVTMKRLQDAQSAKDAADKEMAAANVFAARERGGDCGAPGVSCVPGEGPRWRAANDRIENAKRAESDTARTLAAAQKRLQELNGARDQEAKRREGMASSRLTDVSDRLTSLQSETSGLARAYDQQLASRESLIRQAVERDPRHTPRAEGLLVRLQALTELAKDPAIGNALFGLDALLILLELAAVLGKTLVLIPMSYATHMAVRDVTRSFEHAEHLVAVLSGRGTGTLTETVPAPEPITNEPQPIGANESGRRRHAKRWEPDIGSSTIEVASTTDTTMSRPHGLNGCAFRGIVSTDFTAS